MSNRNIIFRAILLLLLFGCSKKENERIPPADFFANDGDPSIVTEKEDEFPVEIDIFFACSDLNWSKDKGEITPWNGYVMVRGNKYSCRDCYNKTSREYLGTIGAGDTVKIIVP